MDLIESTLVSAAMEFDDAEVESSYEKTWEATAKVLEPTHPARFKVCDLGKSSSFITPLGYLYHVSY